MNKAREEPRKEPRAQWGWNKTKGDFFFFQKRNNTNCQKSDLLPNVKGHGKMYQTFSSLSFTKYWFWLISCQNGLKMDLRCPRPLSIFSPHFLAPSVRREIYCPESKWIKETLFEMEWGGHKGKLRCSLWNQQEEGCFFPSCLSNSNCPLSAHCQ